MNIDYEMLIIHPQLTKPFKNNEDIIILVKPGSLHYLLEKKLEIEK